MRINAPSIRDIVDHINQEQIMGGKKRKKEKLKAMALDVARLKREAKRPSLRN